MGGPAAEPSPAPTITARTGVVETKLPESDQIGSLHQPTATRSPPPAQLADLLREAETQTRRLAQRIAASSSQRNYKIQLGLFIEPGNARRYGSALPADVLRIAHDDEYRLDQTTIEGIEYQRLYVGRFNSLHDSLAACDAIKEIGTECYVVY